MNKTAALFPSSSLLDVAEENMDTRTRAVLSLLFDLPEKSARPIPEDPLTCPNCDKPEVSIRSPYCSEECKEESAFVRQFRMGVREQSILDLEKQAALGQKLWHVLNGGYPRRVELVPPKAMVKILEREGQKCQECGALATTIDHSGSG
jgi:hypothetical protein